MLVRQVVLLLVFPRQFPGLSRRRRLRAIVLGDPVGIEAEIEPLVRDFEATCRDNDWDVAFYQVPGESLLLYERLGFRKLKVGEDAIVDLTAFSLQGKTHSKLRSKINQFSKAGISFVAHEPPLPPQLLAQAKDVSDSWLSLPGRRERAFALGLFEPTMSARRPFTPQWTPKDA